MDDRSYDEVADMRYRHDAQSFDASNRRRLLTGDSYLGNTDNRKKSFIFRVELLFLFIILVAAVVFYQVYQNLIVKKSSNPASLCLTNECVQAAGLMLTSMDLSANPCSDAYNYTCGNYMDRNESYNKLMKVAADTQKKELLEISEKLSCKDVTQDKSDVKFWDAAWSCYYNICTNYDKTEEKKLADDFFGHIAESLPFLLFNNFTEEASKKALTRSEIIGTRVALLRDSDVLAFIDVTVDWNPLLPSQNKTFWINNAPLSMPNYSFVEEKQRKTMKQHVSTLLKLFADLVGDNSEKKDQDTRIIKRDDKELVIRNVKLFADFEERAEKILEIEKALSRQITVPQSKQSPPYTFYGVLFDDLASQMSTMSLRKYFEHFSHLIHPENGLFDDGTIVYSRHDQYFRYLSNNVFTFYSWGVIHDYLLYKLLDRWALFLHKPFRDEAVRFMESYSHTHVHLDFSRCIMQNNYFSWTLARHYVSLQNEDVIEDAKVMKLAIYNAIKTRIGELKWMDSETKKTAYTKLEEMQIHFGYPSWLKENPTEMFKEMMTFSNLKTDSIFTFQRALATTWLEMNWRGFSKPMSQTAWEIIPFDLHVSHDLIRNEVNVPYPFLKPPFFYPNKEGHLGLKAINYGLLGTVLAKNMLNSVYGVGRYVIEFAKKDWWDFETEKAFKEESQCFDDEYATFPDADANFAILDNGAANMAFKALREVVGEVGLKTTSIPGIPMSHADIYLLSYMNTFCCSSQNDWTSSNKASRVKGIAENFNGFAKDKCDANAESNKCVVF